MNEWWHKTTMLLLNDNDIKNESKFKCIDKTMLISAYELKVVITITIKYLIIKRWNKT